MSPWLTFFHAAMSHKPVLLTAGVLPGVWLEDFDGKEYVTKFHPSEDLTAVDVNPGPRTSVYTRDPLHLDLFDVPSACDRERGLC